MLTRIDHVMICVADLDRGIEMYRRLGFDVQPGGVHPGRGTHNAIAFHREDYLEVLSVRDADEYRRAGGGGLLDFIAAGGGLRYIALQSDDLAADVAAIRSRGVDVSGPTDGGRRTPAGQTLRWRSASLPPDTPLPIFFIQHLTPLGERRGPGPFQALHRTTSMEAAATWMADHGVPPPARGIRNTGEEAMLVGPEHTGGLYVGFVGPR